METLIVNNAIAIAERRLFAAYGLSCESRSLPLADPALAVRVLESGAGSPVVFVHGSGMTAATWAPVLAQLPDRRALAVDLPGFGLSDSYSYTGRTLRQHAVAQLTSLLDALGLDRVPLVGTSLGAMWTLCMALDAPQRVTSVVALGMPAVALPGLHADAYFKLLTTPGIGRLVSRAPAPRTAAAARKGMAKVLGPRALARTPDVFFDVVCAAMTKPGWGQAMWSHLNLAMRRGRPRPGTALTDEELRSIAVPVSFGWGDSDVYGGPEIGEQAVSVLPHGSLTVIEGGHAPFLDDPERCAQLVHAMPVR
jgi:pimeloyl-ACP methyl ester carboxylesterase